MDVPQALLDRLETGALGDPLPVLAYVAGQTVELGEVELNDALRRALLLRAAGGDPRREPEIDDRAVKALAVDLFSEERGVQLGLGLDRLAAAARDLPGVRDAAVFLAGDLELAWRLYALALLAEELAA